LCLPCLERRSILGRCPLLGKAPALFLQVQETVARRRAYYFSTRDLLMMAVLAALGGVASTYVQTLANAAHAALGFPGATQVLAGLHVVWLVLAVGLTGKQGAGTVTGIVKGGVEFLSGNTHGILIILIDVVAGILVDLGMLPFRNKNSYFAHAVAGGIATASNVFVFQLFASVPSDMLAMSALLLVGIVSFISGVLLAGLLGKVLLDALRRAGVVKDQPTQAASHWVFPAFLGTVSALTVLGGIYLYYALQGPPEVRIVGAVAAPYSYNYGEQDQDLLVTIRETAKPGLIGTYTGIPLREIIARAQPADDATTVLVRGSDGYDFFIQMTELEENHQLILAQSGSGGDLTYNVAGAKNSKAWVRNVVEMVVVGRSVIKVGGALASARPYDPDQWQFEMDNARLDLGYGVRKYQGVSLSTLLEAMQPQPEASTVTLISRSDEQRDLALSQVMANESIRVFNVTSEEGLTFSVANEDGEIWLKDVVEIQVT
jgi:ABC-type thiamin/hydroxymethylpyrimidine transport system permease subunit/DMSO/TMAO reductase YedYZ molybdopterin-dependent catalytic subunit